MMEAASGGLSGPVTATLRLESYAQLVLRERLIGITI
jgi:hypothetical protein